MDDLVIELAVKTGARPEDLRECPGCGNSYKDEYELEEQHLSVSFHCKNCKRMGELDSEGVRLESGHPLDVDREEKLDEVRARG